MSDVSLIKDVAETSEILSGEALAGAKTPREAKKAIQPNHKERRK